MTVVSLPLFCYYGATTGRRTTTGMVRYAQNLTCLSRAEPPLLRSPPPTLPTYLGLLLHFGRTAGIDHVWGPGRTPAGRRLKANFPYHAMAWDYVAAGLTWVRGQALTPHNAYRCFQPADFTVPGSRQRPHPAATAFCITTYLLLLPHTTHTSPHPPPFTHPTLACPRRFPIHTYPSKPPPTYHTHHPPGWVPRCWRLSWTLLLHAAPIAGVRRRVAFTTQNTRICRQASGLHHTLPTAPRAAYTFGITHYPAATYAYTHTLPLPCVTHAGHFVVLQAALPPRSPAHTALSHTVPGICTTPPAFTAVRRVPAGTRAFTPHRPALPPATTFLGAASTRTLPRSSCCLHLNTLLDYMAGALLKFPRDEPLQDSRRT